MTPNQMTELEFAVNEKIRAGCKMFPTLYESKDDPQLLNVTQQFTSCLNPLTVIRFSCLQYPSVKCLILNVITILLSKMTSHCAGTGQMRAESESGIRKHSVSLVDKLQVI